MAQQIFLRSKSSGVAVTQPAGCGGEGYEINRGEWSIDNDATIVGQVVVHKTNNGSRTCSQLPKSQ